MGSASRIYKPWLLYSGYHKYNGQGSHFNRGSRIPVVGRLGAGLLITCLDNPGLALSNDITNGIDNVYLV